MNASQGPAKRPDWWLNCAEIARLLRWLEQTDCIDLDIAIDVVSTPWSWSDEYQEMLDEEAAARAVAVDREMRAEAGEADDELREMITDCEEP